MDAFIRLSREERSVFFEGAAIPRNMQAQIVEKDFWVCWTLKELFGLPGIGDHLIFKGGTSLSKAFKVIDRFSEDIDVSIDRAHLGFGGANEPEAGGSNKEKQRRVDALKAACQAWISTALRPALELAIRAKVTAGQEWSLRSDDDDPDQQTLLFEYPSSFPSLADGYIRRAVKIELGARADHWPCESRTITPMVAEQFPRGFHEPSSAVKVLSAERTFWEKATILHAEFHRPADKPMPERFSRHYSDFHELIRKGVARSAAEKLELLARVAAHKSLFFRSSWARYGEAAKGTLRIVPPPERVKALRHDYARMQPMFFGQPAEFDRMIEGIGAWEAEFNRE